MSKDRSVVKMLITGAICLSDDLKYQLEEMGAKVTFVQNELETLTIDVTGFEVVICNGLFLYNDIERFTSLAFIQATSAGTDRLPLKKITERGITLCSARGVYSVPMAEWAVGKVLEIYKHTRFFYTNQQSVKWIKDRNIIELQGKIAAVVGFGSVGIEVAKRLCAFGVDIVAVDIIDPHSEYASLYCPIDNIVNVLPLCDIVILTLPLTEATHHLFNRILFDRMKRGVVLVNIARGGIVCLDDLLVALDNGFFSGVALDVFNDEPLHADSPLWHYENVIITPHNSFVSDRITERLHRLLIQNFSIYHEKRRK